MKNIVVIGGGIIGLSSAFYLQKAGYAVTVIDKDGFKGNCSYGNLGYVCPSHFIPLAAPGMVWKGLKWMLNNRSPFYVQPSLNSSLMNWGLQFMRSATKKHVAASAVPLRDIALISHHEYSAWAAISELQFAFEHKGLLEVFQSEGGAHHAAEIVDTAKNLGLEVELLNKEQLTALEPQHWNALGAIYFKCDSHLYPDKLMTSLLHYLQQQGVRLLTGEVKAFEKNAGSVTAVVTNTEKITADEVVVATGAWSRQLASLLDTRLALMPGRGYSFTVENAPSQITRPVILTEGRVAMSLMDGNKLRIGGTMEIVSTTTPPRYHRVDGIRRAVTQFLPQFVLPEVKQEDIWYGYRPTSADGLPYIGRIRKWRNVVVATGHSMLGLSLGAGTGRIVSDLISEQVPAMDLKPFAVERFT
jgi:D-amino-acid dehydrogenase